MRRPRGTGSLFLKNGRWWVKYYANGEPVRESTGTKQRRKAERFLRKRLNEVSTGTPVGPSVEAVTFETLMQYVREDYRADGKRSLDRVERAIRALGGTFAGMKAVRIKTPQLKRYAKQRIESGRAGATARYELSVLRRGFNLAAEDEAIAVVPKFPKVTVAPPRRGFFEDTQVEAVERELPEYLRAPLRFAVLTGWRRMEVFGLTWDRVDFEAGIIRLEVGTTKNDDGRTFPIDALPALVALLRSQWNLTETVEAATGKPCPWVFHRFGKPIRSHYAAWRAACERAGVPGRVLHDCRRTAVRNLERAGVSRSVATALTGHKTESIFRRYAITNEADLREGVAKLALFGHRMGTANGVGRHGADDGTP